MKENLPVIGRVVFSKSGRDMGRYYIITEILSEDYVMICDGNVRPLAKPKKKKVKHLNMHDDCLEGIAEKIKQSKKVFDKELGSSLRAYNNKN